MRRRTERHPTTETRAAAAKAESASGSTQAGQRLSEAQSADHAWRTGLLLGLYHRIRWLRRFDRVVQYTGAGVGVALLLAAFAAFFGNAGSPDADALVGRVTSLTIGATSASASGLTLVNVIAWCQARIRRWIVQLGLDEHLEQLDDTGSAAAEVRSSSSVTEIYIKTDRFFAAIGWALFLFVLFHILKGILSVFVPS